VNSGGGTIECLTFYIDVFLFKYFYIYPKAAFYEFKICFIYMTLKFINKCIQ